MRINYHSGEKKKRRQIGRDINEELSRDFIKLLSLIELSIKNTKSKDEFCMSYCCLIGDRAHGTESSTKFIQMTLCLMKNEN